MRAVVFAALLLGATGCGLADRVVERPGWRFEVERPPVIYTPSLVRREPGGLDVVGLQGGAGVRGAAPRCGGCLALPIPGALSGYGSSQPGAFVSPPPPPELVLCELLRRLDALEATAARLSAAVPAQRMPCAR